LLLLVWKQQNQGEENAKIKPNGHDAYSAMHPPKHAEMERFIDDHYSLHGHTIRLSFLSLLEGKRYTLASESSHSTRVRRKVIFVSLHNSNL